MARRKRLPPGPCTYCLKHCDELEREHVFPKSWYPDSTPPNAWKWWVPSCPECNDKYQKVEDELLVRFASGIGPYGGFRTVYKRVIQSVRSEFARDRKDARKREEKRQRLLREIDALDKMTDLPPRSILNLGSAKLSAHRLWVPGKLLNRLTEKLVRGMTYVLADGLLIDSRYEITKFLLRPEDAVPIIRIVERYGKKDFREGAIKVGRAAAFDDMQTALYVFDLWDGKFFIYATVMRKDIDPVLRNEILCLVPAE